MSANLGQQAEPIVIQDDYENPDNVHPFLSLRRKRWIVKNIVKICRETGAAPNIRSIVSGFGDDDLLIEWMDKNVDWVAAQKVLLEVHERGYITQDAANRFGARDPRDTRLQEYGGIYLHITTTRLANGDTITRIYVGSARAGIMSFVAEVHNKKVKGLICRTSLYRSFDELHAIGDFNSDEYVEKKKTLSTHAEHWPTVNEKVIHNVWILAFSFDTDDVYRMICGDEEMAARDLRPVYETCSTHPQVEPFRDLRDGAVFFLETYVLFTTGYSCVKGKNGSSVSVVNRIKKNEATKVGPEFAIWQDCNAENHRVICTNQRIPIYEKDGASSDKISSANARLDQLDRLPQVSIVDLGLVHDDAPIDQLDRVSRSTTDLHRFFKAHSRWIPLPLNEKELEAMGLPTALDKDTQGRRKRAKKMLSELKFDGKGESELVEIGRHRKAAGGDRLVLPQSDSGAWTKYMCLVLQRRHPPAGLDAPSYQTQPELVITSNNATLILPKTRFAVSHFQVVIDQLDAYGLVPSTLTGISIRFYSGNGKNLCHTSTRNVGQELLGPEYEMLSRTAALLRIALAFHRASSLELGLGKFFQAPAPIPKATSTAGAVAAGTLQAGALKAGLEVCDKAIKGYMVNKAKVVSDSWTWHMGGLGVRDGTAWNDLEAAPRHVNPAGTSGYLLVHHLPVFHSADMTNPYAEAMTIDGVHAGLHEEQLGHMRRLVTPVLMRYWVKGDAHRSSLRKFLPCGLYLLRFVVEQVVYTVFVDTAGAQLPPGKIETYLDEFGPKPLASKVDFEGWTFEVRKVPHPYVNTRAYFATAQYPEELVLVRCHPVAAYVTPPYGNWTFYPIASASIASDDAEALLHDEIVALLDPNKTDPRASTPSPSTLLRSVLSASRYARLDRIPYDAVALCELFKSAGSRVDGQQAAVNSRLFLSAIERAAGLAWPDLAQKMVYWMLEAYTFETPVSEQEVFNMLGSLTWDLAIRLTKRLTKSHSISSSIMCKSPVTFFWDAFQVEDRDYDSMLVITYELLVIVRFSPRERKLTYGRAFWLNEIYMIQVAPSSIVRIYQVDDDELKLTVSFRLKGADLVLSMRRWHGDVRYASQLPMYEITGTFLASQSSQDESSQGRTANDSQGSSTNDSSQGSGRPLPAPRPEPVTLNHYSRQDTATMDTFTNNNDKEGDDDDDNDDDDDGNDDDDEIEASQIPIRPKKRRTVDR